MPPEPSGGPLLAPLIAAGTPVRCLVRDPRRLGPERVRVEIALGDLGDHLSFRHALRGVDTVVHLASVIRDQPGGSIEELAGVATWRLVRAAEREGVKRFVFFSTLGASTRSRARLMRAKAVAEGAVVASSLEHTVFAPSIIYAPGDPYLRLLQRISWLPVMAIPGNGGARFQPICAGDVAACVMAALAGDAATNSRYELAGPQTLTHRQIVALALRSFAPPAPRSCTSRCRSRGAAEAGRAARRPDGVRHLGRGRAARGPARLSAGDRRRRGARRDPQADAGRARRRLAPVMGEARGPAHGSARSSCAASASSSSSRAGGPMSCTPVGRPSSPW